MALPPEELEAMLLRAIPRYRWTAEDVTKGLDLKGRTVIVTGATSGIGIPTAVALAKTGCSLVVTARDATKGKEVLEAKGWLERSWDVFVFPSPYAHNISKVTSR